MKRAFIPFPVLETQRLVLRKALLSDIDRIFQLRSDPEVTKYIKREKYKELSEAVAFLEKVTAGIEAGKDVYWAICLKNTEDMIGSFSLWNFTEEGRCGEMGYDLGTNFQGQGYMSEAMKAVMSYAFEQQNFESLQAFTDVRNEASKSLLISNHFKLLPELRDPGNENNRIYRIERSV